MKKIVYLLFLPILFAFETQAQTFTMQHDTVKIAGSEFTEAYNYILNNSQSTIDAYWRIIDHNVPQSWKDNAEFGLCDNVLCYTKSVLAGSTQKTDTFGPGKNTLFKLQFDLKPALVAAAPANSPVYVTAEISSGNTVDTTTFIVYKWTTSVPKTQSFKEKDEVTIYPNPATTELNVTFNNANIKSVAVYNLLGKQMVSYKTSGNSAKLDIDKIPSGIYFVRLMDGSGHVISTRRFTHQ